jgi:hypothetical protein
MEQQRSRRSVRCCRPWRAAVPPDSGNQQDPDTSILALPAPCPASIALCGSDPVEVGQALGADFTTIHAGQQRATRFVSMGTIPEATVLNQWLELDVTPQKFFLDNIPQTEFTDARGIDQTTPGRQVEQARGTRGIAPLTRSSPQFPGCGSGTGQQGIHQRRFADTGRTHQRADTPGELALQIRQTRACRRRHLQDRVPDLSVDGTQLVESHTRVAVDQIGLVQHQAGWHATQLRGDQIAIEEFAGRYRQRGENEEQLIEIGGDRLQFAVPVRPSDHVTAWFQRRDHTITLAPGRLPDHMIPDHELIQSGAEVTALKLAIIATDFDLAAIVGRDEARAWIAEIRRHIGFLRHLPTLLPAAALALDLCQTPALTPIQFLITHASPKDRKYDRSLAVSPRSLA